MRYKYVWLFYLFLLSLGILLISLVSLPLEIRLAQEGLSFVIKQILTSIICFIITYTLDNISFENLKKISWIGLFISLFLTIVTLYFGEVRNGVRRWMFIGGYCIQSTELLKVCLIIPVSTLLTNKQHILNMILIFVSILLILLEPDLGMGFLTSSTIGTAILLVGEYLIWYIAGAVIILVCAIVSFCFVAWYAVERVMIFMGKTKGFQIKQALKVWSSCNFIGEANYNIYIPDEHCDFIFTKLCAYFGIAAGLLYIICLFFIVRYVYYRIKHKNKLTQIICSAVILQFSLQNMIHILSNLGFIPTKGMTLPLVGFGGSGMISYAIAFGILFNTLKNNP